MPTSPAELGFLQFLKKALQTHHRFISGSLSRADSPIYVIGNPSADLDSILSALVYSYFANDRVPRDYPRPHVPLINLDNVYSGSELSRLRPEFVKALQLSRCAGEKEESLMLKEHFLTVADFKTQLGQAGSNNKIQADSVLVDWNALPVRSSDDRSGRGSLPGLPVEFTVVGCIDHHADESFLPSIPDIQPNHVEPAGSCTSLVVAELQKMNLWRKSDAPTSDEQLAKLSLAAILIDTTNLTSKDKVTSHDTLAYGFLLPKATATDGSWKADEFYSEVNKTKQNSLELLTIDEILGRDYKQWTEKPTQQTDQAPLEIGICSVVKSMPWIVRKAGNSQAFANFLKGFASERKLDVVAVMTAFSSAKENRFSRELLVYGLNDRGVESLKGFVSDSSSHIGLETWHSLDGDDHIQDIKNTFCGSKDGAPWARLWVQGDLSKSRKQVAPLMRGAAACL